jgi:hypothetical protein
MKKQQHLRDLVLQLYVLADKKLAIAQCPPALPDGCWCHVYLGQKITAQAVGNPRSIDAVVLLHIVAIFDLSMLHSVRKLALAFERRDRLSISGSFTRL